jgi:hypothetical protein
MRTAVAHDVESRHREIEEQPTLGLAPADSRREGPDAHFIDATQGRQIGSDPYDDATQGSQIGSDPYDDATRARQK